MLQEAPAGGGGRHSAPGRDRGAAARWASSPCEGEQAVDLTLLPLLCE
jgi:hypothetical protein